MLSINISIPIFKHDTLTTLDNEGMSSTHGCISSIDISIEEVFDTLTNLDPSKASALSLIIYFSKPSK